MDIHKPKPWHGSREFLKEVATIVLGVLIAIGAEQLVERLHWVHEVQSARAALAREIAVSNNHLAYRVAAEPCIARRLDALESVIEAAARREPTPHLGPVIPDIGNAFNDNIWANYRAAQTLPHFGEREQRLLSAYYLQIGSIRGLQEDETGGWSVLKVLQGDPARLGPVDIAGLRIALQHARFDNQLIAGIAADELETSKRLNIKPEAADASRVKEVCGPLSTLAA
jgi:CRP-like cAMP-binding protein